MGRAAPGRQGIEERLERLEQLVADLAAGQK
jgi:hypothetical protein